jgi:hypothetical protein
MDKLRKTTLDCTRWVNARWKGSRNRALPTLRGHRSSGPVTGRPRVALGGGLAPRFFSAHGHTPDAVVSLWAVYFSGRLALFARFKRRKCGLPASTCGAPPPQRTSCGRVLRGRARVLRLAQARRSRSSRPSACGCPRGRCQSHAQATLALCTHSPEVHSCVLPALDGAIPCLPA